MRVEVAATLPVFVVCLFISCQLQSRERFDPGIGKELFGLQWYQESTKCLILFFLLIAFVLRFCN